VEQGDALSDTVELRLHLFQVDENKACAFLGKSMRDRLADAARAADDNRDLTV